MYVALSPVDSDKSGLLTKARLSIIYKYNYKTMKVRDLTTELAKLNPDAAVFLSSDAEGNAFHGIAEVDKDNEQRVIMWSNDEYLDREDFKEN